MILSWILFFAAQTSFRWRYKQAYGILKQLNDIFTRMTSRSCARSAASCRRTRHGGHRLVAAAAAPGDLHPPRADLPRLAGAYTHPQVDA